MDLMCQDIHFGIGEKKILKGVSLKLEGKQFHTILGPNGSGKTSLLKLLYRQEKPDQGLISLDGKPLEQMSVKETANRWQSSPSSINSNLIVRLRRLSCWAEHLISLSYKRKRKRLCLG